MVIILFIHLFFLPMLSRCLALGFATMLFLNLGLEAQVSINNSIFPTAGTVLEISRAVDTPLSLTPASNQAQQWDFSMLRTARYREDTIQDAQTGAGAARFPTAEVLLPLVEGFGTAYVDVGSANVQRIGAGVEFLNLSFIEPFSNPQTLQVAPLTYLTAFNDNYQLNLGVAIDSVPFLRTLVDTLLASSPLPGGASPDSLRLKLSGQRRTRVDAFGSCLLPDGQTYPVVRQSVTDINAWAIEARIRGPFGVGLWLDVTPLISSVAPLPIPQRDTAYRFDFWANNFQQPLVSLLMADDNLTVEGAEFKGQRLPDSLPTALMLGPDFSADWRYYPNPSLGQLSIEWPSAAGLVWRVEVLGLDGRRYWLSGEQRDLRADLDLSFLPSGFYVLQLCDEAGRPVSSSARWLRR